MPFSPDIQKHIQISITAAEERLLREREEDRQQTAEKVAGRGLRNSGIGLRIMEEVSARWLAKRIDVYASIYLDTCRDLSIPITDTVENEILSKLNQIALANYTPNVPPMVGEAHRAALVGSYKREMQRTGTQALNEAKSRVSLAKLKSHQVPTKVSIPQNVINLSGNSRINYNSNDNSTNVHISELEVAVESLAKLSEHAKIPGLAESAAELHASIKEKTLTPEKIGKWVTLASSSASLMHQAMPYLGKLYEHLQQINF
jgi:hypothetical protein